MLDSLMQAGAQEMHRRQFGEVFADADGFGIELQEFHLFDVGCGAEDEADRGFLAWRAFVLVQPTQVKLHLPNVGGLERLQL